MNQLAGKTAVVTGGTEGFAKLRIWGKEIFFWMMLAALTLPEVVLLTPLFSTFTRLGLFNTYAAVILPLAALQIPFTVLLTRNFVASIPDGLFDAARVDGAGVTKAFWYIILPLTRPIAAAIVILTRGDQRHPRGAGLPEPAAAVRARAHRRRPEVTRSPCRLPVPLAHPLLGDPIA